MPHSLRVMNWQLPAKKRMEPAARSTRNIVELQVGEGRDMDNSALIRAKTWTRQTGIVQVDVNRRRLPNLQVVSGIVRVRLRIDPAFLIERQAGKVATGATNLFELLGSVPDCIADFSIAGNHAAWNGQSDFKDCRSGYIGTRQLVHKSVAVWICSDSKALFRLNPVMLVERVVGELTNGDDVTSLMVGANDKIRRFRAGRGSCGRCQPDNLGRVPAAIQVVRDHPEGHTLRHQCLRCPWSGTVPDGLKVGGHLSGDHLEIA